MGRRGLLVVLGAITLLGLTATPVGAAQHSHWFTIVVRDCVSHTSIRAGAAEFGLTTGGVGAVQPIAHGVAGPIGLGPGRWRLKVTSPGYLPAHRLLIGLANPNLSATVHVCLRPDPKPTEKLVDTTYPIAITCTSTGEVCDPTFMVSVNSDSVAQLTFTASPSNCSDITLALGFDGSIFTSDPLAPGQSTFIAYPPVAPGSHLVTAQATGIPGGCNAGTLVSWAGSLVVTTSAPV